MSNEWEKKYYNWNSACKRQMEFYNHKIIIQKKNHKNLSCDDT